MTSVSTCLWFDKGGEAAAAFYLSVFADSKRLRHLDAPVDTPSGLAGERLTVEFELDGQRFMILNGGPHYQLSPAVSIVVNCDSQDEVDYFWDRLVEGGAPVTMRLADRSFRRVMAGRTEPFDRADDRPRSRGCSTCCPSNDADDQAGRADPRSRRPRTRHF